MLSEPLDFDKLTKERREALAKTLHSVTIEELRKLGDQLFPMHDDAWRERFVNFLNENTACTFQRATTHEGVEIIYCRAKERGIWFLPGSGLGILQASSLKMMKELADKR
jgi:hypothetical protein